MSRPPKPFIVLKNEKKSHMTKTQLKNRKEAEESLLTGVTLKERPEVNANPVAHKEFLRINRLLKNLGKNDAMYEAVINRYCLIQAECIDLEEKRESCYKDLNEFIDDKETFRKNEDLAAYYKLRSDMQKNTINIDKQIQTKRRMLLDIEKENVLTISASLRSIPKKVVKTENPLLKALKGKD